MDQRNRYVPLLNEAIHPEVRFGRNVRLGFGVVIERGCTIGDNTIIGHYSVLRPNTHIGSDCVIGHMTVFEGNCTVGDRTLVHAQCHITKGVSIGEDVFIAPFFIGANTKKIVHGRNYPLVLEPYRIGRAVRIAIGVQVLPGVVIGDNAMIGAGALVTRNVPEREVWIGRPAKKIGIVPEDELLHPVESEVPLELTLLATGTQ
jgi:UDP-2-acetamido-3-amino-2,3-dideoxy-glucuronate N-acetyltransferase